MSLTFDAMNNFESQKVEDCFDGSRVYQYRLAQGTIDEAFIRALAVDGKLEYFPRFPRPFFRVRSRHGLQLKGVQGEPTFQVILPGKEQQKVKDQFEDELKNILIPERR